MKKKSIVSFVILLLCAAAVFFFGWVSFRVPPGKYGVMLSKTGGVYSTPLRYGHFEWRWEALLPTNAQIRIFDSEPIQTVKTISGSLPSADVYSNLIEEKPDFSYKFSVTVHAQIDPDFLPAFVEKSGADSQKQLHEYITGETENIAHAAAHFVLDSALKNPDLSALPISDTELIRGIDAEKRFRGIAISTLHIDDFRIPDTFLYNTARNAYTAYQMQLKEQLEKAVDAQTGKAAADYLELERLSRLGRILSEYPLLIDYLSVSKGKSLSQELPRAAIGGESGQNTNVP